jgi:hypothetical protein
MGVKARGLGEVTWQQVDKQTQKSAHSTTLRGLTKQNNREEGAGTQEEDHRERDQKAF